MSHRYRAPTANGAVLAEPGFEAIPGLVEANHRLQDRLDVLVGGLPLRELRALARREALDLAHSGPSPDVPLLLAGHQPELSHPGVWVKNFALNGVARKLGGIPLNLIVDNDTLKNTALRFPTFREGDPTSVKLDSLPFDTPRDEMPYEDRAVADAEQFRTFADRARPWCANWGFTPLLPRVWPHVVRGEPTALVGERFTAARRHFEREWGCSNLELPVSRLSQTESFARFASHILTDLKRFRTAYNAAIHAYRAVNGIRSANHPAPDLAEGEAPFWVRTTNGRRERANSTSDVRTLRPRALTLTLFARVCLGDFFIHGIGGGKYDEVTDAIIRDYFGSEPPAYQVLSATLRLPLPAFRSTAHDLAQAQRRVRDLVWNPQRYLSDEQLRSPEVKALAESHAVLAASEPSYTSHVERQEWFRALRRIANQLRPFVAGLVPGAEASLTRVQSEVEANAILQRRDYAWVLYPEEMLRPFLQEFL